MRVSIYDTTLRDGTQMEGISFSAEDKIRIAHRLDSLGVDYVEGGWPGSCATDVEFFKKIRKVPLKSAKIVAFGSTRHTKNKVENDPNVKQLLEAETEIVTIFGKSWDLHVRDALRVSLDENIRMIYDTVEYLKRNGRVVIYDAEHFFDAYKANPEYATKTIKTAEEAGCDLICLCDTNGGMLPSEVKTIIQEVKTKVSTPLGIHAHNDSGVGVANSICAVEVGVVQVQGTINGYGERAGNADLTSVIPNLKLKLGIDCVTHEQLQSLTDVSRFVREIANQLPRPHQPYVGHSAFSHKGGVHISGVARNPRTYEHIEPELVGNHRHILASELSGRSAVISKASEYNIDLTKYPEKTKEILDRLKDLEAQGYEFEAADASFELMIKRSLGLQKPYFRLKSFRVIVERGESGSLISEATVKLEVGSRKEYTVAEGDGPINALDTALREALGKFYPVLKKMHLTDYKVRVLDAKKGTAAKVRVLIESSDNRSTWGTVGVSENIIEASWEALVDSIDYTLSKYL